MESMGAGSGPEKRKVEEKRGLTPMIDHTGRIEAGEKTIADRDAEIDILQRKAQGTLRVMDKLAVTVEDLQAELADMRMKHGASRKQAGDLEAKLTATVTGLQMKCTGQMSKLEIMLGQAEDKLEEYRRSLAQSLADMNGIKIELDVLRMEHDKCPAVIAELRKQIKDTTDALETRELCGRLAVAKLEDMLVVTEQKLQKHRQSLCACLAGKEAKMATMRQQLAKADQRHALLSGECWV